MNYLHGFHAGNHADVLKHMVLLALLARLRRKEKPFFVLDTHAGRGQYLIQGEQARKTDEARGGIFKLIVLKKLPDVLNNYLKQVERVNPVGGLINYPGSPLLIAQQLRDRNARLRHRPPHVHVGRLTKDAAWQITSAYLESPSGRFVNHFRC